MNVTVLGGFKKVKMENSGLLLALTRPIKTIRIHYSVSILHFTVYLLQCVCNRPKLNIVEI